MREEVLLRGATVMILAALFMTSLANPYMTEEEEEDLIEELEDYIENPQLERQIAEVQMKRGSSMYTPMRTCVKRKKSCVQKLQNCCYNSTCRCNLLGSNCRCQRMGLFQKLGK